MMRKFTGEATLRSRHDETEWTVAAMRSIDGNIHENRHFPGSTPSHAKSSSSLAFGTCAVSWLLVPQSGLEKPDPSPISWLPATSRDDVLEVMQDARGFPDSIRVVGNKRNFLISTLRLQPLATALPAAHDNMHVVVGAMAVVDPTPQALAATQGQLQEAASSSSDISAQERARIRGLAEARARELALRLTERIRQEKTERLAAEAAAEAAAAQAAEAAEEEPEVGLHGWPGRICS